MHRLESKITRSEVELFIEAWIIRNMHLAVLSGNRTILFNDNCGIVINSRSASLEEGKDQDNAKFPGQCAITLRRWSRNRFREVTDGGLFCLAEINTIVKFLKDNKLSTL